MHNISNDIGTSDRNNCPCDLELGISDNWYNLGGNAFNTEDGSIHNATINTSATTNNMSCTADTHHAFNHDRNKTILTASILAAARKRVCFKDSDGHLKSVCVFRPTERPSYIFSLCSDSDCGSETVSSDNDNNGHAGPWRRQRHSVVTAAEPALVPLEVADVISQIPSLRISLMCFIRLESITPILPT